MNWPCATGDPMLCLRSIRFAFFLQCCKRISAVVLLLFDSLVGILPQNASLFFTVYITARTLSYYCTVISNESVHTVWTHAVSGPYRGQETKRDGNSIGFANVGGCTSVLVLFIRHFT